MSLATLVLWHWPHWLEPVSQLWWPESGRLYAFTSSVGSTFAWPLWGFVATGFAVRIYRKHFECHEEGCRRHGRYVVEGGVRCCDLHHPALDERPPGQRGRVHRVHAAHLDYVRGWRREGHPGPHVGHGVTRVAELGG